MFVLSGLPKNASFPAGFAAPYEAEALSEGGEFIGGQGLVQVRTMVFLPLCFSCAVWSIQLVSYSESPVGKWPLLS